MAALKKKIMSALAVCGASMSLIGCTQADSPASSASARITGALDGSWWQSMSSSEKQAATKTLIAGYVTGFSFGKFTEAAWTTQMLGAAKAQKIDAHVRVPQFSYPTATYVGEIDQYYNKNPGFKFVPLDDVVGCLADLPPPGRTLFHPNIKQKPQPH